MRNTHGVFWWKHLRATRFLPRHDRQKYPKQSGAEASWVFQWELLVFVPRILSDRVTWLSKQLISTASTADCLHSQ